MIITKLINNLKCLTQFYQSLVTTVDQIEATIDDPFITESVIIEASETTQESVTFALPDNIQIVSILLVRVGSSGFDDVESIEIDNTAILTVSEGTSVVVQLSGDHELNDYEVQVIYYYP